jgi:hypothetical protein
MTPWSMQGFINEASLTTFCIKAIAIHVLIFIFFSSKLYLFKLSMSRLASILEQSLDQAKQTLVTISGVVIFHNHHIPSVTTMKKLSQVSHYPGDTVI